MGLGLFEDGFLCSLLVEVGSDVFVFVEEVDGVLM